MVEFYGDPDFESKLGNCLVALSTEPKDSWREKMQLPPGLMR